MKHVHTWLWSKLFVTFLDFFFVHFFLCNNAYTFSYKCIHKFWRETTTACLPAVLTFPPYSPHCICICILLILFTTLAKVLTLSDSENFKFSKSFFFLLGYFPITQDNFVIVFFTFPFLFALQFFFLQWLYDFTNVFATFLSGNMHLFSWLFFFMSTCYFDCLPDAGNYFEIFRLVDSISTIPHGCFCVVFFLSFCSGSWRARLRSVLRVGGTRRQLPVDDWLARGKGRSYELTKQTGVELRPNR